MLARYFTASHYRPWHRRVWVMALPLILSNMATPLLGMVDTAVVGHLDSPHYLGAVALGAMVFSLIFWGFGFLRMGTTGLVAQSVGADDYAEVRAHLIRALMIAVTIGVLLIVLQKPIAWLAFTITEASEAVKTEGKGYFAARIWGAPASLANYCLLGWFLALNRTGTILALQLVLNGTNIALDLLFVVGWGMTADGVGYASMIAEYTALALGIFLVIRTLRHMPGTVHRADLMNPVAFKRLFVINRDIIIRTLCLQCGFLWFMAQSGQISDITLAANAVLIQFLYFASYALDGFAATTETLAGRAKGQNSREDLDTAFAITSLWALAFGLGFSVIYGLAGPSIIGLLTGLPDVQQEAVRYLPYLLIIPAISVAAFQLDGVFLGTTATRPLRNGMIISLISFLATGYGMIGPLANHGLWIAMAVLLCMRGITLALAYPALRRSIDNVYPTRD
ncbi:MAG: MATE family efflux transporter [Pseudomonadota bacterium]